jgi:hypothetical protein
LDPVRELLSELWPSALQRLKHVVEHEAKSSDTPSKPAGRES